MDLLNARHLIGLAGERGGTRVSLFLPTHRAGPQIERNRIRLKNLLRRVEQELHPDSAILEPARALVDGTSFWHRPSDGLAVFIGPDGVHHVRVPLRLPETAAIGDRFLVGPLLPLLTADRQFYVLALSQDDIQLFRGSRYDLEEVSLDGLPLALWLTMPRRQQQVHAFVADRGGAGARAVFHGGSTDQTALVRQHFRRVDRALRDVVGDGDVPLVLAGVRSTQDLYRQVSTYPNLVAGGVEGSTRDMSPQVLHRQAWPLAAPVLRGAEAAAHATYRSLAGTGRTAARLTEVADAAGQGRVETLFLRNDAAVVPALVRLDGTPDREEQRDRAAVATLRHGGQIYTVPGSRMPDETPACAILRY